MSRAKTGEVSALEFRERCDAHERAFEGAVKLLLLAVGAMATGLAVAAVYDPTVGGALVLGSWAGAVVMLHRLGRLGARIASAGSAGGPGSRESLELASKDHEPHLG